ncbi:hypothetical protein ABIE44_003360 [Marmoricola sp. OAE513]|uniref:hypothetical protein n=1 Tax=Marmoricola sp. OAE513 TaxID=2817894 RepID=UPI001AEA5A3F
MTDQEPPGRIKDIRVYRDSFVGMAMLACTPFLIFGALQVYGWWAAIAMFVAWALILFQGTRWFMPHPRRVIYLGLLSFAIWTVVVVLNQ